MPETLHCCPVCSALPPDMATSSQLKNYFCQPSLWHGRRSGKFWIVRRLGCSHGPVPETSVDVPDGIVAAWNAWAKIEADAKAERIGWTGDRRAWWRYHLGIDPHPVIGRAEG